MHREGNCSIHMSISCIQFVCSLRVLFVYNETILVDIKYAIAENNRLVTRVISPAICNASNSCHIKYAIAVYKCLVAPVFSCAVYICWQFLYALSMQLRYTLFGNSCNNHRSWQTPISNPCM